MAGRHSAAELAEAVRRVVPGHSPRHPALRTFQALRIVVNRELDELAILLQHLPMILAPEARAVVISFQSLEDRLVKEAFRNGRRDGSYADASRKVITAGAQELAANRRAAPAKLRWARRAPSVRGATACAQ